MTKIGFYFYIIKLFMLFFHHQTIIFDLANFVNYFSQNGRKWLPSFQPTILLSENNAILTHFVNHSFPTSYETKAFSDGEKHGNLTFFVWHLHLTNAIFTRYKCRIRADKCRTKIVKNIYPTKITG